MIKDRIILCVASSWEQTPTSKHHVMKLLAQNNDVIWVSYHGTRRPTISLVDIRQGVATLKRVFSGAKQAQSRLTHITPFVLPGVRYAPLTNINRRLVVSQIRRVLKRVDPAGSKPVQLWTFAPDVDFLAGQFNEEKLVYYCVDEYALFEGMNGLAIRDAERRLIDRSDVVVTTSRALYESKSPLHHDVHLIRHGVDVRHFSGSLNGVQRPGDIDHLSNPIVGFFGLLHHWVDVDLIADVAGRLPDMHVVLIGDAYVDITRLKSLPNVHLLGRRPYTSLPGYCARFDAAILPFKCNAMTPYINPIKLREYLAAGLPVVSTPMAEAEVFGDDVVLASDAASFADACRVAVGQSTINQRTLRAASVADQTWEHTVERLSRAVTGVSTIATTAQPTPAALAEIP